VLLHHPQLTLEMNSVHLLSSTDLKTRLHCGRIVRARRAELEVVTGPWRASTCLSAEHTTLLKLLPDAALMITRDGDALVVRETGDEDFEARLYRSRGHLPWPDVEHAIPGVTPGAGIVPRYWLLEERVSSWIHTYAAIDLNTYAVVWRSLDRASIERWIADANRRHHPPLLDRASGAVWTPTNNIEASTGLLRERAIGRFTSAGESKSDLLHPDRGHCCVHV
jgi:hypothetical protein